MTDHRQTEDPERPPAFAVDTVADKVVRFGCGAILVFLLLLALAILGVLPESFGTPALVTLCVVLVIGAGSLSVSYGEPFIRALLKLIKWFA